MTLCLLYNVNEITNCTTIVTVGFQSLGLGVVRRFLVGPENLNGTLEPWNRVACCWVANLV